MNRLGVKQLWPWLRIAGALGILAVLVWQLGTQAFLDGHVQDVCYAMTVAPRRSG